MDDFKEKNLNAIPDENAVDESAKSSDISQSDFDDAQNAQKTADFDFSTLITDDVIANEKTYIRSAKFEGKPSARDKWKRILHNKTFWITTSIILVIVVAFSVMLPIFLNKNKDNRTAYDKQEIIVIVNGESKTYAFDQLAALVPIKDFTAVLKTSEMRTPRTKTYSGINIKSLFTALDIDVDAVVTVDFTAKDGHVQQYGRDTDLAGVYIACAVEGKAFNEGIKSAGYTLDAEDGGPLVVIDAGYEFSNTRVKMLVKIEVYVRV